MASLRALSDRIRELEAERPKLGQHRASLEILRGSADRIVRAVDDELERLGRIAGEATAGEVGREPG